MPRLVLLFGTDLPVEQWAARLREDLPEWEVDLAADDDQAAELVGGADAVLGTLTAELLARAPRLRWLQSPQADPTADFWFDELLDSPVTVTNFRGIYDDVIGAHATALLLALARGLDVYSAQQQERRWEARDDVRVLHLPGATLLVVGVGGIGQGVTRYAAALGMQVLGTDARRSDPPDGMIELRGADALDELLPRADAVVNTVPHVPATERLFSAERFGRMRRGAFYVSVGRGGTTDTDALSEALADGRLGGAALDVVDPEPLPTEHPLWRQERVILTPHVATAGPDLDERRYAVVRDNCRRLAAGDELVNVVDKESRF